MDYINELKRTTNFLKKVTHDFNKAKSTVSYEQGVMQDISHKLECFKTTEEERKKLATIYANAARNRRKAKERIEVLCSLHQAILQTKFINKAEQVVKEMELSKEHQAKRQYSPRTNKIDFENAEKFYG